MNIHKISGFSYENMGGNPAGVVITDEMLSDEKMLSIAKEVNYSETAFLIKVNNKEFRIRYFSPEMEIAFCGHATIASGHVLAEDFGLGEYKLNLNDGSITINIVEKNNATVTSISSVSTKTEDFTDEIIDSFIDVFNFSKDDLDSNYPIKKSYSGNFHLIIFVKEKKTLENMKYDFEKAKELSREHNITTISVLWKENNTLYHSRNPFPFGGVYEDPATGSAAIALGEYLRSTKNKISGEIEILQGFDMDSPSKLYVEYTDIENSSIKVSGQSRVIK
ncbi:PhzF family phenazine biosynthesis protein [Arcobacter sp. LA11]|uniref:PhzF family phenazine biosynthesis protein n=1 Tax=Arcobacter sp. LA11 TaxID=1898176 RepID=UPI0009338F69|nr:PhzF family phenazine biosynthesis protein [Arcobacter sp. LA11]